MFDAEPLYRQVREGLVAARGVLASMGDRSFSNFLDLVSAISTQDADYVIYVGAGGTLSVSLVDERPGGAPFVPLSWRDLLVELFRHAKIDDRQKVLASWARRAGLKDVPGTIEPLLSVFDRLHIAWMIGQLYLPGDRDRVIRDLVQPQGAIKSALLTQLARLAVSDAVTVNYDDTFQTFLEARTPPQPHPLHPPDPVKPFRRPVVPIFDERTLAQSFSRTGLRLFYLHGSVKHPDRHLVLDRFDYAKLMSERDGILDYVTYLLRSKPTIYVGFSLDDPSFNLMETRLFASDEVLRPVSYAFVSKATTLEHDWWAERNLRLIEFEDHSRLPELIRIAADARAFLVWAEPAREPGTNRNHDRTQRYLEESLTAYIEGRYDASIDHARAALATTLLWGGLQTRHPFDLADGGHGLGATVMASCRLVDIRTRLALGHYKKRYVDPDGMRRININIDEARDVLTSCLARIPFALSEEFAPDDAAVRLDAAHSSSMRLRCYQAQVDATEARVAYGRGEWGRAADLYGAAIRDVEPDVQRFLDGRGWISIEGAYDLLKAVEAYAYSRCQLARIVYQGAAQLARPERRRQLVQSLCELRSQLERLIERFPAVGTDGIGRLDRYFRHSFSTMAAIASWFAGRSLVGSFADVIPTKREREDPDLGDQLTRGIELLSYEVLGDYKISARWLALRARYKARAQFLRWFIASSQRDGRAIEHMEKGYAAMCDAICLARPVELQHEFGLAHLELCRLTVISLYGAVLFGQATAGRSDLGFSAISAREHLQIARASMPKEAVNEGCAVGEGADALFLKAICLRLDAYLGLVCEYLEMPSDRGGQRQTNDVVAELRRCYATKEGPGLLDRAADFETAFESIRAEFSGLR